MKWRDTTSWSKTDKDRSEPREVTAKVGYVKVLVHRHRDYPGKWLATFSPEVMYRIHLEAEDLESAKLEALRTLHVKLTTLARSVRAAVVEMTVASCHE